MNRVRLLPVLVFGLVSLLAIKLLGMALDNNPQNRRAQLPSAGDNFARSIERARVGAPDEPLTTASVPAKDAQKDGAKDPGKDAGKDAGKDKQQSELPKASAPLETQSGERPKLKSEPEGIRLPPPPGTLAERGGASSQAERDLLERLRQRRDEIEAQSREVELRDQLLRQTERKLDERIGHLRTLEVQNESTAGKADPKARFKPLVVMYENMKPKEAARVFDRLDIKVLIDLVGHMNPRKVSEILAVMDPAAAERLTVAMARIAQQGSIPAAEPAAQQGETELPRLPLANPAQPRR